MRALSVVGVGDLARARASNCTLECAPVCDMRAMVYQMFGIQSSSLARQSLQCQYWRELAFSHRVDWMRMRAYSIYMQCVCYICV